MAKGSGRKARRAKSAFTGKDTSFDFGLNAKPRRSKGGSSGGGRASGSRWNGGGSPGSGGGSIRA